MEEESVRSWTTKGIIRMRHTAEPGNHATQTAKRQHRLTDQGSQLARRNQNNSISMKEGEKVCETQLPLSISLNASKQTGR